MALSDGELTRGIITSELQEINENDGTPVQQNIMLFNNLSPRNHQNQGGDIIQAYKMTRNDKEEQKILTLIVPND